MPDAPRRPRFGARLASRKELDLDHELSLNKRVAPLLATLVADADVLRVTVSAGALGETLIDAGLAARGSLAAGLLVAEVAMGGLGRVTIGASGSHPDLPWTVAVRSSQPALACLGSQVAGWHLTDPDGYDALGSGPARALAAIEPVFRDLDRREHAAGGVLLLESARVPPPVVVREIAQACGLHPSQLTLVLVPTWSLAGSVQVAARVLEAAIDKAHRAGFPLRDILDGLGTSPLAPPHPDPIQSMGRTNDAMMYGGTVHLYVGGADGPARDLADHLPSVAAQHGRFFADVLAEAGGDFYQIDSALFGPASVRVTAVDSGATFSGGRLDPERVSRSFARG